MKKIILFCVTCFIAAALVFGGGTKEKSNEFSVLVYVTGITAGSPSYELMVQGVEDFAVGKDNVKVKVYEAGYNQAEWESQLTDLTASGEYDLIVTSNPALPDICINVAAKFPYQKFIITDAYLEGNPQIKTYLFNQYEQSLILGYLAGLITTSSMEYANSSLTIGFIAAQEFPLLTKHIVPGFIDGAQMVNPNIKLDYRVIGNWYDAGKSTELANSMIATGTDVFTTIAGSADTGLIAAAKAKGAYIVYPNINLYSTAPGIIVGCGTMGQREVVRQAMEEAYDGSIVYGKASIEGISAGIIDFIDDDPLYGTGLTDDVRHKFDAFLSDIRAGRIFYTVPSLDQAIQ